MMPFKSLLTIASSLDSTMAASCPPTIALCRRCSFKRAMNAPIARNNSSAVSSATLPRLNGSNGRTKKRTAAAADNRVASSPGPKPPYQLAAMIAGRSRR